MNSLFLCMELGRLLGLLKGAHKLGIVFFVFQMLVRLNLKWMSSLVEPDIPAGTSKELMCRPRRNAVRTAIWTPNAFLRCLNRASVNRIVGHFRRQSAVSRDTRTEPFCIRNHILVRI